MGTRADGGERLTEVDLLIEVLSRLRVKPLLRYKSVSKSWYHLISSPSFAKSHLQRAITRCVVDDDEEKNLIVRIYRNDACLKHKIQDDSFSLLNLGTAQTETNLKFPYPQGEYLVDPPSLLVGFVCGIACVCVDNSDDFTELWRLNANPPTNIYLWNPTIKQSKLIPQHTIHDDDKTKVTFGFGFDPIEFDFKVVRIVSSVISPEVYSANRDAWRNIDSNLTDVPHRCTFELCLHGFLITTGNNGMMAFDLNKEVFVCNIKLPFNLVDRSNFISDALIADYKDSIAVIVSKFVDRPNVINLWTLDDEACLRGGGVEASWTLKLKIVLDLQHHYVHGFYNSADFLLYSRGWYLYNLDKNVGRHISFKTYVSYQGTIFKYSESLISFAGSKLVNWHADEDDNDTSKVDLEDDTE